jgi:hypothetical protein
MPAVIFQRGIEMRFLACALTCALLLIGSGCSQPTVSGTVTFDGQPVSEGHIAFVPESGTGQGGGANIVNGAYTVKAAAGKYRVEINASRMTPLPPGRTGMDGATSEVRAYIPQRYNLKTELRAEVPAAKKVDFELKS